MAIPYPSSPTVGQTFTYGGITYTWNGVAWVYTQTNTPAVVGSVAVTAPITNTGTPTAPVIGINQSALSIAESQVTNLVSDLAGKANLVGGNSFTDAQIIGTNGTANIGLVVIGTASQSANLQEWRISTGGTVARVDKNGAVSAQYFGPSGAGLLGYLDWTTNSPIFNTGGTGVIGLVVKGVASQSADLISGQNSGGTTIFSVASSGALFTNSTLFNTLQAYIYGASDYGAALNVQTRSTAAQGIIVRGRASQSADALQLQDSGGNTYLNMSVFGGISSNLSGAYPGRWSVGAGVASTIPLVVRGAASQTADLQQWQNSAGGTVAYVASSGFLNINNASLRINTGGATYGARIQTNTDGVAVIGQVIRATASQTANLQEWQSSAGSILTRIASGGGIFTGQNSGFGGRVTVGSETVQGAARLVALSVSTTDVPFAARRFTGQTSNILELQDESAGTATWFNSSGYLRINGDPGGQLGITAFNASSRGIVVRGAASQTANLQEWQNSSGGTVALVNSSGDVVTPNGAMFIGSGYLDAKLSINTQLATQKGIVVRAATSQTADLQQWQNSSGGTVSYIKADGSLYINSNSNTTGVYWKGTSSDQSIRANGNDLFVTPRFDLIYSPTDTTGRLRPGTDNAADLGTTGQRWKNLYATGAVLNSLSMSNATSPILLNGSAGTTGQVLTSGGAGTTPTWTTVGGGGSFTGGTLTSDLVLAAGSTAVEPLTFQANTSTVGTVSGAMEYDGTVFYQTSNTNPGKALATQNYYYVSNADYGPDFTINSTAKSLLGGATVGLTVAAGTTYEYELITAISHQYVTTASISGDYLIVSTTVSGSPVVATAHQVDYGSNTTGFTTATTLSTVRPTGNVTFMPAITSGTRYAFLRAKGLIRVTGTGTVKIYPAIQTSGASGSGDNIWNVRSGTIFKLTPVGNGTVTQVGAFA